MRGISSEVSKAWSLQGHLEYDTTAGETRVFASAVDTGRARIEKKATCGGRAVEGTGERIQQAFSAVHVELVDRSGTVAAAESCAVEIACGISNDARRGIRAVGA